MVQFPSQDIKEPHLTAEPELSSEKTELNEIPQTDSSLKRSKIPDKPKEIQEKEPEKIQTKRLSKFQYFFHDTIAKPLIGPPQSGNTTFTIELSDNTVSGFYQMPKETRSIKELGPMFITKTKKILKTIRERDIKKDIKNLKNLPAKLKKTPSKINIDAIKTIPKKIRTIFSSD